MGLFAGCRLSRVLNRKLTMKMRGRARQERAAGWWFLKRLVHNSPTTQAENRQRREKGEG